jgi:hypothetical protein
MSAARKTTKRKRKPASPPPKGGGSVDIQARDRSQRLGSKHVCFSCGLKFYDMNRPEPICPRCQSDQRHKPKESAVKVAPHPPPAERKPKPRDLGPLLEEDEPVEEAPFTEDMEIDLGELDGEGALFEESEEEPEPEPEEEEG